MSHKILKFILFSLAIPSIFVVYNDLFSVGALGGGHIGYEDAIKIIGIVIALISGSILINRGWISLSNRTGIKSDVKGFSLMLIGAFLMSLPCLIHIESGAPFYTANEVIKTSELTRDF